MRLFSNANASDGYLLMLGFRLLLLFLGCGSSEVTVTLDAP